jgi:hypothetical protein
MHDTSGEAGPPAPPARTVDLIKRHIETELAGDIEGILATLCPVPHYEIHPAGLNIDSTDSVAEFYRRMRVVFQRVKPVGLSATLDGEYHGQFFGRDGAVTFDHVVYDDGSGEEVPIKLIGVFDCDEASGLLKGERVFMNRQASALFLKILGDDFLELPGVSLGA